MKKKKIVAGAISLAILIPILLYGTGIIAQFIININAWKAAGSNYRESPGLPSLEIGDVLSAVFTFPEGLIAVGAVIAGVALLCIFGLRLGWGNTGTADHDRNLTISKSGSYGTAAFMDSKEAEQCFDITTAKNTDQDILGRTESGKASEEFASEQ